MGRNFFLELLILTSVTTSAEGTSAPSSPTGTMSQRCDIWLDNCPAFTSHEDWKDFTDQCCPENSGLTFHAQRTEEGGCILACLPAGKCQAGEIPILQKNRETGSVSKKCEPCQKNTFEPKPLESYEYSHPWCRFVHQNCRDTKTLQRQGNSTHDATCRCLCEKGFAPYPNTSDCASPGGFDGNTLCECVPVNCPEDQQLNHEYKCVPRPSTTESTTHAEDHTTIPRTITHKALFDVDGTAKPVSSYLGEPGKWIYLAALVLYFLVPAVYLCYRFHP